MKLSIQNKGPVIGVIELKLDYTFPDTIVRGIGRPLEAEDVARLGLQPVPDPYETASDEEKGNGEEQEQEGEEKKRKPHPKPHHDASKVPTSLHALCLMGYKKIDGRECFLAQDNQGTSFGDEGFKIIDLEALKYVMTTKLAWAPKE
ncbi:unnamed protein product [Linum tenue]|uniref:Peptidase C1A papain C-terminal domain-containing protein n=1 Tax=Linum tenue TaxID=586396 RepID=A0AAV0KZ98_9ROSI|nr:unnamed protein product [Linum tenue]CAI0426325.1 unnamed protein product [Linum tenue]CAI0426329.1 unnamed protein product [Linum tenue]